MEVRELTDGLRDGLELVVAEIEDLESPEPPDRLRNPSQSVPIQVQMVKPVKPAHLVRQGSHTKPSKVELPDPADPRPVLHQTGHSLPQTRRDRRIEPSGNCLLVSPKGPVSFRVYRSKNRFIRRKESWNGGADGWRQRN